MGPNQHTLRRQLTTEELASRQAFLDQSQRDADRVNSQFMLAQQQQDAAGLQAGLVNATGLSLETLVAIKKWLAANPGPQPLAGIVESYTEIR
jgi:hypothetical protein